MIVTPIKTAGHLTVISVILLLTSCAGLEFATTYHSSRKVGMSYIGGSGDNLNFVDDREVSVRDWITYMIATGFPETDSAIYLSNHLDKIKSKLPDLKIQGWSSYVIKALLKKEGDMITQDLYNHCSHKVIDFYVPKAARDSIKKFKLLDLPIVGITYEQALGYIEYRQNMLNTCHLKGNDTNYRYECFLPTPAQYDSVQGRVDSINSLKCDLFNYKDCVCANCPRGEEFMRKYKNHPVIGRAGKEPVYIWSYFPNDLGLWNFRGNVAEMTSNEGIAKGGSCIHYASEAYAGNIQEYSKPEFWLGFRVWYRAYPR
jgi:hypothetical protein